MLAASMVGAQRLGERVMARHGVLLAANRPGMACRRRL
jgi:hypothetical protein